MTSRGGRLEEDDAGMSSSSSADERDGTRAVMTTTIARADRDEDGG